MLSLSLSLYIIKVYIYIHTHTYLIIYTLTNCTLYIARAIHVSAFSLCKLFILYVSVGPTYIYIYRCLFIYRKRDIERV